MMELEQAREIVETKMLDGCPVPKDVSIPEFPSDIVEKARIYTNLAHRVIDKARIKHLVSRSQVGGLDGSKPKIRAALDALTRAQRALDAAYNSTMMGE